MLAAIDGGASAGDLPADLAFRSASQRSSDRYAPDGAITRYAIKKARTGSTCPATCGTRWTYARTQISVTTPVQRVNRPAANASAATIASPWMIDNAAEAGK